MMQRLVHKLFFAPATELWVQLFRYFFVGGSAFVVDFGLLYLLTEYVGLYYILSASISFMAGLVVNYLMSIRWVFDRRNIENRWVEFAVFAVIGVIGLGLNAGIIWLFTEVVGCFYLVSKIISTAIVFIWNFVARKFLLFHKR